MVSREEKLRDFAELLMQVSHRNSVKLPPSKEAERFLSHLLEILFPHYSRYHYETPDQLLNELAYAEVQLTSLLHCFRFQIPVSPAELSRQFILSLPEIFELLRLDAVAINQGDPAAVSEDEVILAYPGFFAIAVYRLAHQLHTIGVPLLPRLLSEHAHRLTGIDIHPAALIGRSFCIDHGTGVVVGETTVIKDQVKMYQGVTLGALSVTKEQASQKRHPTIEDNVIIYSNATILGGDTVIGANSIIGGNVWLTSSVPANSLVYHKSEIQMRSREV